MESDQLKLATVLEYFPVAYFGDCDRSFPLFFKQVVAIFTHL